MYIRFSTLLPVAAAAHSALDIRDGSSECNPGSMQCCLSTQNLTTTTLNQLFGTVFPAVEGLVGVGCTRLGGGSACFEQLVCCTVIPNGPGLSFGCSPPLNIGL